MTHETAIFAASFADRKIPTKIAGCQSPSRSLMWASCVPSPTRLVKRPQHGRRHGEDGWISEWLADGDPESAETGDIMGYPLVN